MASSKQDTAAADRGPVKTEDAVAIPVSVTPGAKFPQVAAAALAIARRNACNVRFKWQAVEVLVASTDTYQGIQRRVQRELKGEKD